MSNWVRVCPTAALPPGTHRVVDVDGARVAVFNLEGRYCAIEDVCTHDGGPLAEGELMDCEIRCPRHGARFDIKTGRPLCMPAIEPVTVHAVEVRGDDVYVAINE